MPLSQAIILGIVQGLTEILPISSSGHLILVPSLLGWEPHALSFDAALHLGTALALLFWFAGDWLALIAERRWRTIASILIASVPVGLIGLLGSDFIESNFRGPLVVAGALVAVGILMLVGERWYQSSKSKGKREELKNADIFTIGVAQTLALVPGVSRSGITILAGMGRGLTRERAARFSFLISLPIVFAAGLYELFKVWQAGDLSASGGSFAVGIGTSFVVGLIAVKVLFGILKRSSLVPFAIYRILLGVSLFFLL
ncbi:MAG: undecaprenyl-diphosphate phosphatase [Patescibacteria group bacterium]